MFTIKKRMLCKNIRKEQIENEFIYRKVEVVPIKDK